MTEYQRNRHAALNAPCGTEDAVQAHRARRETCETCRVNLVPGRTPDKPHGTASALRRHQYHRETPCEPCKEVQRQISRDRRARATSAAQAIREVAEQQG